MRARLPERSVRPSDEALAATTPGEIAADEALAPLKYGEAPRVGTLGDSGCGKSKAFEFLIERYLRRSPGGVLIIDDAKNHAQFSGEMRKDRDDLRAHPVDAGKRVVVFRGDRFSINGSVDAETIADLQWLLAQKRVPSLVVYDELDRAAAGGQWKAGKESRIAWALGKGRSSGCASLWGTQETEAVPREAFNQSSCLLVFRMMGNPVRLLKQRGYCEGGVDEVIPTLPGDELPPSQRGYFVLLRRGRPWDRRIYRFGAAARAA